MVNLLLNNILFYKEELIVSMEIQLVGRTCELSKDQMKQAEKEYEKRTGERKSYAQIMREEFLISAGKAAGICYMPDDYLEKGIQDEEKAYKRGLKTLSSGHKTVGEHDHVSFIMRVPKIICILLNSIQIYNTSEKSSRYTVMKETSENPSKSYQLYQKWSVEFQEAIRNVYPTEYTDREIEKLALENARYFLSIFNTETVMKYTISYAECYMIEYYMSTLLSNIDDTIVHDKDLVYDKAKRFINPLKEVVANFLFLFRDRLGITKTSDRIIPNNKERYLYLLRFLRYSYDNRVLCRPFKEYFGDVYNTKYNMTFAAFAQEQRHRTLKHKIEYPADECSTNFYIPPILDHQPNTYLKEEWVKDFTDLLSSTENDVYQGEYISVTESGHFEDFILKCKERLCSRAQLEICKQTAETLKKFIENANNLTGLYGIELQDWFFFDDMYNRCKTHSFICREGCKFSDISPESRDL